MSAAQPISGHCLVSGEARGTAVVLDAPLSLWGGFDPVSGRIIDVHHPQHGALIAGRIVVMPGGRGSSSSPSVLLEAVRRGRHPLALVLGEADPVLVIGALVAADLYGVAVPVVRVSGSCLREITDGARLHVLAVPDGATLSFG
jgi:predicted aconitase with swiveling domain